MPAFIGKVIGILAVVQARYTMQLKIHPVLYFLFYFIGGVHFWITVLYDSNQVIVGIKWLDISYRDYQLDHSALLYLSMLLVYPVLFLIVRQLYVSVRYRTLKMNTAEKYFIKIAGSLGIFITSAFMLTILRSCINIIQKEEQGVEYYMALITVVIYTGIILPFHCEFLADLSPLSGNPYASPTYFNYMRLMPLIRVALCYSNIYHVLARIELVYTSLILSLLCILKEPVMLYNHEKILRVQLYFMIWVQCIRSTASFSDKPIPGAIIAILCVHFVLCVFWLVDKRINQILRKDPSTSKTINILCSFLNNFNGNLGQLTLFLLQHQKLCENPECQCQLTETRELYRPEGINYWYKIIDELIRKEFDRQKFSTLPKSTQLNLLRKLADLTIIQVDYTSKKYKKYNRALYILQQMVHQYDSQGWYVLNFRAYQKRFVHTMEKQFIYECSKEGTINMYAQKFYQYQSRMEVLSKYMLQSTKKHAQFWTQILKKDQDIDKVVGLVRKCYRNNLKVEKTIQQLKSFSPDTERVGYPVYFPYFLHVCNTEIPKIPENQLQPKPKISQDLKYYSLQSWTGTCIVDLNNSAETFGRIIQNNLHFERITGFTYRFKLTINEMLPLPYLNHHTNKMKSFIDENKFMIHKKNVLIRNKDEHLMQASISVQIIPSLSRGLCAVVFLIPEQNEQSLFLCNCHAEIISYSKLFEQDLVGVVEELDYLLDEKTLFESIQNGQTTLYFHEIKYQLTYKRRIQGQNQKEIYHLCAIRYALDSQQEGEEDTVQGLTISNFGNMAKNVKQPASILVEFAKNDHKSSAGNKRRSGLTKERLPTHNKQELQDIKQQNKKEEQRLNNIFRIVKNNQSCFKINLWTVINLAFIVLVIAMTFFIIPLILTTRSQDFIKLSATHTMYQEMHVQVQDALYHIRQANIQAFIDKSQPTYRFHLQKVNKSNQKAVTNLQHLERKPRYQIEGFDVLNFTEWSPTRNDFFLIIEQYVFVQLTHLVGTTIDQLGYDINRKDISLPSNNFKSNFVEVNLNGLYTILPSFPQIKRMAFEESDCRWGTCIQNESIIYLSPVGILLVALVLGGSIYMNQRLKYLKENTYKLFEDISIEEMDFRRKMVISYQQQYFPVKEEIDIREDKVLSVKQNAYTSSQMFKKSTLKMNSNTLSSKKKQQTQSNLSIQSIRNGEQNQGQANQHNTQRELMDTNMDEIEEDQVQSQETRRQHANVYTTENKDHFRLVMPKHSSRKAFCKYFSLVLPLFAFFIAITVVLIVMTDSLAREIRLRDLIYQKIRLTKEIKIYTVQLGLQNQITTTHNRTFINFSGHLQNKISQLYNVERELKRTFVDEQPNRPTSQLMNNLNEKNVCALLDTITQKQPNFQVSFNISQCENLKGVQYLSKGRRAGMVGYLQMARLLAMRFENCSTNCTHKDRLKYIKNPALAQMAALDWYFTAIALTQIKTHGEQIQINFEIKLTILTASTYVAAIFGIVLMILMCKVVRKGFFTDTLEIKSLFHVISHETISENWAIRKSVSNKIDYEFLA